MVCNLAGLIYCNYNMWVSVVFFFIQSNVKCESGAEDVVFILLQDPPLLSEAVFDVDKSMK